MSTNAEFDAGRAREEHTPTSSEPVGGDPVVRESAGKASPSRTPAGGETDNGQGRRPRPGTIIWGLIIAVLAGLLIAAEYASFSIDMGEVMIGLLIAAGIALIAGGVLAATAGRKR